MFRVLKTTLSAVAVLAATASSATATTIFLNSPDYPGLYNSFNSQKTTTLDNKVFDNFSLGSLETILSITWQGQYRPTLDGATEMAPTATDFLVQFWSDLGGTPSALLSTDTYSVAETHQTRLGTAQFGPVGTPPVTSEASIYNYSLDVTPFVAAAGTTYWLMIQAQTGTVNNPAWGWLSSTGGTTYQEIGDSAGTFGARNRAFSLNNELTPVPEPSTLFLFGAGLAGVALKLRRRRTVN